MRKHRPFKRDRHPVYANAMQRAMEASAKLPPCDVVKLKAGAATAFDEFRRGVKCEHNWRSLADVLNIAEQLARLGICSDAASMERIAGGQHALSAVWERKGWALRASEMQQLDEALWLHGVQLDHCSLKEFETAYRRVVQVTRQALAGNVAAGVEVLTA